MTRPKLGDFLSTVEELHALVIGMGEVICPIPSRYKLIDATRFTDLHKEYHYYQLGRIFGVFTWLGIAIIIKEIF